MSDTPFSRRGFLAAGAFWAVAGTRVAGDDVTSQPDGSESKDMVTPEAQKAIDRGLAYLAQNQMTDGSFGERGGYMGNVAITALAGLAFMAGGHHPGRGPYGRNVTKALEYVLSKEQRNPHGFLYAPSTSNHGPMYSHGFGTMFLGEAHGAVADRELRQRIRETLARAVTVIVNAQVREGGWRYQPTPRDADVSVTAAQIMALRSARNAGLEVNKGSVERCVDYIKGCQTAADGGFRYFKTGGTSAFPRSAAALCGLYAAGVYHGREVESALRYLMTFKPGGTGYFRRGDFDNHYYYGHYYAAQAMWTAGGKYWQEWFPAIREDLLSRGRNGGGSWMDPSVGQDYGTAMACIILQIPNNYLPILQK